MLGLHLALTTAGDGVVDRVAAARYLITQTPPSLPRRRRSRVLLRRQRNLTALHYSNTRCMIIPSFFFLIFFFSCFSFPCIFFFCSRFLLLFYFRSAPLLSVDCFTMVVAMLPWRLARGIWMQHMSGNRTVRPEKRNVKHASPCFCNDSIAVTFLPQFG